MHIYELRARIRTIESDLPEITPEQLVAQFEDEVSSEDYGVEILSTEIIEIKE